MSFPPIPLPALETVTPHLTLFDWIDGEAVAPGEVLPHTVNNPSTGEPLAQQRATTPADVERALSVAHRVHLSGQWANLPPAERADRLEAAAQRLMAQVPVIAGVEALTTGIVFGTTSFVNAIVWLAFQAAAGVLRRGYTTSHVPGPFGPVEVLRKPLGVAVAIVPWNSPAALAAHKVANALAAGCPVILKPTEWAPYSCLMLAESLAAAGIPRGVFQIVNGGAEVGQRLVSDSRVRAVSFTGGLQGGRAVAAACAPDFKSLQLELGGNNALVMLPSAEIDRVAEGVVAGLTTLNGQWCRALGRLIVPAAQADAVVQAVLAKLAHLRLGHAYSTESQMGPLANAAHHARVVQAVNDLRAKGGTAHAATPLPDLGGYFFPPTLVTGVAPEHALEEIFGPVATVHPYTTEAEALALANQTPYGLGGYVYGADEDHALAVARQLNTGGVKVNGVSLLELNVDAPRPAWGLSGLGEEGTLETLDVFCGKSVVGVAAR